MQKGRRTVVSEAEGNGTEDIPEREVEVVGDRAVANPWYDEFGDYRW